jgi:epoxyqueuosine reductase
MGKECFMNLNGKITRLLKPYYVDYIGFANLESYQKDLIEFGGNIVKDYKSGISIGIAIPNSIVDFLPQRDDVNVACEYRIHGYEVLNQRLNLIASTLSSYLNQKGFRALPIAVADRTDEDNAIPTISHKTIAHIAGLGWIGKNCLLITKKHGPRVRFITVLTNAPLVTNDNLLEQQCNDCVECVEICPVKAFNGKNYVLGEAREERFDFLKCHNYFEELEKSKKYPVCGMCLYVCPYGREPAA